MMLVHFVLFVAGSRFSVCVCVFQVMPPQYLEQNDESNPGSDPLTPINTSSAAKGKFMSLLVTMILLKLRFSLLEPLFLSKLPTDLTCLLKQTNVNSGAQFFKKSSI